MDHYTSLLQLLMILSASRNVSVNSKSNNVKDTFFEHQNNFIYDFAYVAM